MKFNYLWMAAIAFLLFSCHQNHQSSGKDADPGHEKESIAESEHEHEKNQYTFYGGGFELFVEADAMVSGEKAEVLAHFTKLDDFKPLESGTVTATLKVGGESVGQTLNEPLRKGIYRFILKPENSGEGELIFEIATGSDRSVLTINHLHVFSSDGELLAHDEHENEASSVNTTVFTKEQSWKIDFATAVPQVQAFGPVIKTLAKIEPARGEEEVVAAKAAGIVVFSNNNLVEGKNVASGEKLFSISSSEMAENNFVVQLAEAKSNYETSKANYERKSELLKDRLVSEQELLNAKNSYETSKAVYENLSRNFNTSGQLVSSKISGFIQQIFVSNGQYVAAGQPLVSITQNNKLLLTAQVQQQYLPLLPSVISANFSTLPEHKTYTLEDLNGKIISFGKSATDNSFLFPVSIEIANHSGFVPGTFTEVYLKTLTNPKALTVPNSALLEEQGLHYVFVQANPELFEKREIKIGGTDGLFTEVISGVKTGERIVTRGAMQVKLAHSTGSLDAHSGHVH